MNSRKRFNLWELAKILLALGLLAAIVSRIRPGDFSDLLANLSPVWLAAGFVAYFLMGMAKALQYYALFDGRVSYFRMLYITIVNNTISNFIANSAGIVSYFATLKVDEGIRLTRSAVVFAVTKVTDILFIGLFLGISSAMIWPRIQALRFLVVILLGGIGLLMLAFAATLLFRKSFVMVVEDVLGSFRLMNLPSVQHGIESLRSLAEQGPTVVSRMVVRAFWLSFLYFVMVLVMSVVTYRLFSIPFEIGVIVFITCLLQLITLIPIGVFGGLGVNEISLAYVYAFFGVPQGEIPAIVIGIRVLSYLFGVCGLWYLPAFTFYVNYQKRTV